MGHSFYCRRSLIILGIVVIIGGDVNSTAYVRQGAQDLFTAVTTDYNRLILPNKPLDVSLVLAATHLNYLDVKSGQFSLSGWLSITWQDPYYNWAPTAEFGNAEYLFLSKDYCWRPQLVIDNAIENRQLIGDDSQLCRVDYTSEVLWEPPGTYTVMCDVDARYFPFDEQTCYTSIAIWTYNDSDVKLNSSSSYVNMQYFEENSEWTLLETYTETKTQARGKSSNSILRFVFRLKRKSTFYIFYVLVPYILTSFLGLTAFLLPLEESGKKMSFSVSILIALVGQQIISCWYIPSPTVNVPIIVIFFFTMFVINISETFATILLMRLYAKEWNRCPVPASTQIFARKFLATITCYFCTNRTTDRRKMHRGIMPANTKVRPSSLKTNAMHVSFDRIQSASTVRSSPDSPSTIGSTSESDSPISLIDSADEITFETKPVTYNWSDIGHMVNTLFSVIFLLAFSVSVCVFLTIMC